MSDLFTVKIENADGDVVFAGFLEPDQFKITHYPNRPSTLTVNIDESSWEHLTARIDEHMRATSE